MRTVTGHGNVMDMNRGDRVLAWWPGEAEWWYAGTVVNADGGSVEVQFDDSLRADLAPDQVKPLSLGPGARVHVRWRGGESYYPGRITESRGGACFIQYDDGDTEWASTSAMRVNRNDL